MYKGEKPLSLSQADKFVGNRGLNRWLLAGGEEGGRLETGDGKTPAGACGAAKMQTNKNGVDLLKARIYDLLLLKARHDAFVKVDDSTTNRFAVLFSQEYRTQFGADADADFWLAKMWDQKLLVKNAGTGSTIETQMATVMTTLREGLGAPAVVLLQEVDSSLFKSGQRQWHSELGLSLCSDTSTTACSTTSMSGFERQAGADAQAQAQVSGGSR